MSKSKKWDCGEVKLLQTIINDCLFHDIMDFKSDFFDISTTKICKSIVNIMNA